jgi:putative drug exporter of the RND superfamily
MHVLTRRLGDFSARRPWAVIGVWLAALATMVVLAGAAGGAFADDFSAPGSQSKQAQQLLEERFPGAANGTVLAVFIAKPGDTVAAHRDAVAQALDAAGQVDGVAHIADAFTPETVSADGTVAYAAISFDTPATDIGTKPIDDLYPALAPARTDGLSAEVGGDAAFINAGTKASGAELFGVLAALVILVVAFGAAVAALVPIALALVAVAIGLSSITLLASVFDVSTGAPSVGALIGLGIGIDYSLLVVSRYRENRAAGQANKPALSNAMAAVGSAVVFAGGTIILAMLALLVIGITFLTSMGLAVSLVVLLTVTAAMTLLPALLTVLGDRVDRGRIRRRHHLTKTTQVEGSGWWRFAHRVARRPLAWLIAGTAVLLTLAAPALSMKTGFPDAGDESPKESSRIAYGALAASFGPGINGPMILAVDLKADGASRADLALAADRVAEDPGIASVGKPRFSPAGDAGVVTVIPTTGPTDAATNRTLDRIRDVIPAGVSVTGLTAMTDDLTAQLSDKLPIFIGTILLAAFLLLMLVFRSVVVPVKAAVMNLLSIGAAYGVVVAIFQWGWLQSITGLDQTLSIVSPFPILFFAILFGLSMDYEVFLLSRIREEYDKSGEPTESVARGVAATGRVITSAALIMTAVFLSFVANPSPLIMMMGVGLATAVVVDATIVRMVLVPATMELLGHRNWWLPTWLDRVLPNVAVHPPVIPLPRTADQVPSTIDLTAGEQVASATPTRKGRS